MPERKYPDPRNPLSGHSNRPRQWQPRHSQGADPLAAEEPGFDRRSYGRGNQFGRAGDYGRAHERGEQRIFPKGYTRSDERITEELWERLLRLEAETDDLSVRVQEGRVVLEGTVASRPGKHRIEDIVAQCPGVGDVDNQLRIRRNGAGARAR